MGKVFHFEIPAKDMDRAKKFYSTVFGWQTIDWQDEPYTLVKTAKTDESGEVQERGAINGGIVERNKNVPSPVISILVDDLEESIRQIENAGGRIIEHRKVISDRMYSYCKDTEGNVIGVVELMK